MIAIALSEAIHLRIWAIHMAPVTYLNGCLLFVAGFAVVRSHNFWTWSWPALVILLGWLAILGGLFLMCCCRTCSGPSSSNRGLGEVRPRRILSWGRGREQDQLKRQALVEQQPVGTDRVYDALHVPSNVLPNEEDARPA
jgi:hypothetical protein